MSKKKARTLFGITAIVAGSASITAVLMTSVAVFLFAAAAHALAAYFALMVIRSEYD